MQLPLPLLDVLADMKTSFFGLCLSAGQQVFHAMMEQDREQLCGPKNVPKPFVWTKTALRSWKT